MIKSTKHGTCLTIQPHPDKPLSQIRTSFETQNTKAFNLSISELAPPGPLLPALEALHFRIRDAWCKQQGDGVGLAQGASEGRVLRYLEEDSVATLWRLA